MLNLVLRCHSENIQRFPKNVTLVVDAELISLCSIFPMFFQVKFKINLKHELNSPDVPQIQRTSHEEEETHSLKDFFWGFLLWLCLLLLHNNFLNSS